MEGINLFYLALAAVLGGILVALMGAWNALAHGEKWCWPKFGVSIIVAVIAGAAYAGIGSQVKIDLWLGLLTAVGWGAGIDVLSNRGISLLQSKSTTIPKV